MQISTAPWLTLLTWLIGLAVSGAIILAAGAAGLWLLKKLAGEANYGSITLLIAVMGGLFAVYQGTVAMRQKSDQQARHLVFARDLTTQLMFLASQGDIAGGDNAPLEQIPPSLVALKLSRIEATSKALEAIDIKEMPSAKSMSALVRARAGAANMLGRAHDGLTRNVAVDFDRDIAELGNASAEMLAEESRLYPIYQVGPLLVGRLPQQR
ncbi:MAG: hypothetical protein DI555_08865 [Novosphingobium pentaromativorans]|uniref:Uncharacterized protein n=1 Tax=Novosphingobium pentaromativorans TaxID=205844 RepID=A0A2W5QCZ4_9SPHN|nr:MAG: hypothetical protein DI555_08865 [Novosphingobium pentaromativorans]